MFHQCDLRVPCATVLRELNYWSLRGHSFAVIYICKWCICIMVTHDHVCLCSFMHVMREV